MCSIQSLLPFSLLQPHMFHLHRVSFNGDSCSEKSRTSNDTTMPPTLASSIRWRPRSSVKKSGIAMDTVLVTPRRMVAPSSTHWEVARDAYSTSTATRRGLLEELQTKDGEQHVADNWHQLDQDVAPHARQGRTPSFLELSWTDNTISWRRWLARAVSLVVQASTWQVSSWRPWRTSQREGSDMASSTEDSQTAILPVVQKQHQLLVTLLLCNAAAMEALPIFLDRIFHPVVAVILSVTFVLAFGEVIPQAICTRYGLAVGANFVWLVRILMVICYPIAYPIGKLLDCALGHNESALFRRAQLKALVSIHGKEAGKGGELTHDETTIISGALDLTEKTAEEAMTPIESTFSLDVDSKLDWEAIGKILARGHSRVPVYSGNPRNIIGLLLVKSLLTVRAETETPVSAVSIRRIPRVPADMPLYDILNEFQKGSSHMAAVVKAKPKNAPPSDKTEPNREAAGAPQLTAPLLSNAEERVESVVVDIERPQNRQVNGNKPHSMQQNDTPSNAVARSSEDIDDGEVIGIITLEDVFEELLQEEIVDETDEYVDVHKRIRVAAAAAASSVARAPSARRLTSQKAAGAQSRPGQPTGILKKPTEGDSNPSKHQVNLVEPLLENKR